MILRSYFPQMVSTFRLAPRTAWVKDMGFSVMMSAPSLWKTGCGFTVTLIRRSPASPFREKLPFFDMRRLTPESTPLGIVIVSLVY